MRTTVGIIRKIDELGRIVVPIEIRRAFGIGSQDSVEIHTTGDGIMIKKHMDSCVFCGSSDDLIMFKEKTICPGCAKSVADTKNQA